MNADEISLAKHELTQEVSRVWQQYTMSFPKFIRFVLSRGITDNDQQFLRCLQLVDKEPERELVEQEENK